MILAQLSLAALALSAPALPGPVQTQGATPAQDPTRPQPVGGEGIFHSEGQLQVVFLANEGYLLRSGNFSVLIDAFVKEAHEGYGALPKKAARKLVEGKKPFNGFVFALVSHAHPDHFQARVCERFLRSNRTAALMSSPQVVNRLVNAAEDFESIKLQARAIGVEPGEVKGLDRGEMNMGVEFMLLPHAGLEEDSAVQNYGHLIRMGGFNVLHVGDAAADPAVFEGFDFPSRDVDIAIFPYWFFMSPEGIRIVDELVGADYTIVSHMPPSEQELFVERMKIENPHVIAFTSTFESQIFDKSGKLPEREQPSDG